MTRWPEYPRSPEPKPGAKLVFQDDFEASTLDRIRWSPFYLPHWSKAETAARYHIEDSRLVLRVDSDQPPWCPEYDGEVRVSALQTGQFSGPGGCPRGQHRFQQNLVVRRPQATERLYTPHEGQVVVRARAEMGPGDLVSLYLIGFEDSPEDSGEITVFEIFGRHVHEDGVVVGRGIKNINDPRLRSEFIESKLPIGLADWHEYAIDWTSEGVRFFLDDRPVGSTTQSPRYAMQLMLTCYRLEDTPLVPGPRLEVDYVRGYESNR